ncbi:MAG TPA: hypothetical protein DDZ96_04220, partial [Porphyromonadaceae bacterium]|nr:hypothetical protein [Porphyromonadaceae bacterium]
MNAISFYYIHSCSLFRNKTRHRKKLSPRTARTGSGEQCKEKDDFFISSYFLSLTIKRLNIHIGTY